MLPMNTGVEAVETGINFVGAGLTGSKESVKTMRRSLFVMAISMDVHPPSFPLAVILPPKTILGPYAGLYQYSFQ